MRVAFTILLLLLLKISFSQNLFTLQITCTDKPSSFFQKKFSFKEHIKDSAQASSEVKEVLSKLRAEGFLAASVDSMKFDSMRLTSYIYVGEKFESVFLKNGNIESSVLLAANAKGIWAGGKKILIKEVELLKEKCSLTEGYNEGDRLKVFFEIRGREYNSKYYNRLNNWYNLFGFYC